MAESPIQSSFIPRDASAPAGVKPQRGGLYDLLMLVSVVLFIASVVLAVGVFLYVQFLQSESASKLQQLQRAEAAFEPKLIEKLTKLDDRMRAADDILSAHIAPSVVFAILEQTTLETVQFRSLDFQAGTPDQIQLRLEGTAQSVNSIALQADIFGKSSVITDPIFSGIQRQSDGVSFSVSAFIKPSAIRYASVAAAALSGSGQQSQPTNPSPFGVSPQSQTLPTEEEPLPTAQ